MNKLTSFKIFLDENKKLYINANTRHGKTLLASILALFFLETHPNFHIISNYTLNIYNKKTNKKMTTKSKYSIFPYSKLMEGNFLVIIDDFVRVKRYLQNFGNVLAVFSGKLNVYIYMTLHYYTHLSRENRILFNSEVQVDLKNLIYNESIHKFELSEKSKLNAYFYNTNTEMLERKESFINLLDFINGNIEFKNVYVKDYLYDTFEIVDFISDRKIIYKEILKWSKTEKDIKTNLDMLCKTESKFDKYYKELIKLKNKI